MNHLKSGMESLLMGEGIGLMGSKDTYREPAGHEEMGYENKPEGDEKPELPSYEELIEMIGLDNIYAMMASKTDERGNNERKQEPATGLF